MVFTPGEGTELVLAGMAGDRSTRRLDPASHRPGRLLVEDGIPGRGRVVFRYLLASDGAPTGRFAYQAEKARDLEIPLGDS